MSDQKTIVVDLDGTLCRQVDTRTHPDGIYAYDSVKPRRDVIDHVNNLWKKGWRVVIHTARGMRTFGGNVAVVEWNLAHITRQWLDDNGVKYDELKFGKPPGDYYLDDKNIMIDDLTKLLTIVRAT